MGQPVRKIIKEQHPEIGVKPIYTLIVDGNNLLRQSMRDTKTNRKGVHYGGIYQFFLQIKMLMGQYQYDHIYVVFDDSDSGILRYELYNEYKANRDKHYAEHIKKAAEMEGASEYWKKLNAKIDGMQKYIYNKAKKVKDKTDAEKLVDENFDRERNMILEYCDELFIRTLFDDKTEGDDFIAYYVNHKKPEERIVIVSSDQDLTQLISDTVCVYDRMQEKTRTYEEAQAYKTWYATLSKEEKEVEKEKERRRKKEMGVYLSPKNFKKYRGMPLENILVKKIFCGDSSDNIGNIKGLSEERLTEMMPEIKERPITVEEVKERAKTLIDERISEKKKPLSWHENIVSGTSNKEYNGDFYEINDKIINLKKPLLTPEAEKFIEEYMYAPIDPEGRSFSNLYKLIVRDDIENLKDSDSFSKFFEPFKALADREIKKFKNETK